MSLIPNFAMKFQEYIAIFFSIFLTYLAALFAIPRLLKSNSDRHLLVVMILGFTLCFRLLMISTPPTLSTDIMRFAWDGRVFSHGIDPYAHAPSSAELDQLKDVSYFEAYDHKEEITPYPPVAQLIFLLAALLSGDFLGLKLTFTLLDLMNCLFLTYLLKGLSSSKMIGGLLLYSWSPLLIVEFSSSGHMDSLPIFFVLLSIILLSKSHFISSAIFYSLGVWSKAYPILLLPLYFQYLRTQGSWAAGLRFLLVFALSSFWLLLPLVPSSGANVIAGQLYFVSTWFFNPSTFFLLHLGLRRLLAQTTMLGLLLRILMGLVLLVISTRFAYVRHQKDLNVLADSSIIVLGLMILLAPAVFPWYVSWILAFCALIGPNLRTLPWILLSATVNLSYLAQFVKETNIIHVALAEYVPVYATIVIAYSWPYLRSRIHSRMPS